MALGQSTIIPPFPDSIDRVFFGSWMSGFVAGEGTFALNTVTHRVSGHKYGRASFSICIREDDEAVLRLIRSYWQCGTMHQMRRFKYSRSRPAWVFCVTRSNHLRDIVAPHFERYPLVAKKARDFEIWK
jgi:hypothetical protein